VQTYIVKNIGPASISLAISVSTIGGLYPRVSCKTVTCHTNGGGLDSVTIARFDSVRILVTYQGYISGATASYGINFTPSSGAVLFHLRQCVQVPKGSYTAGGELAPYQTPEMHAFSATYAHHTAPYIAMDAPQSFTLVYNSDRALPYPTVGIDLTLPQNSATVQSISLTASSGGTNYAFSNGETTLYFQGSLPGTVEYIDTMCVDGRFMNGFPVASCLHSTVGDSAARIYGRLNLTNQPTAAIPLTLTVQVNYTNGYHDTRTASGTLLVVNDRLNNTMPRGWAVAGLQRVYNSTMIVEGGGAAVLFTGGVAPDYSTLQANGSGFTRTYQDGTVVQFDGAGRDTSITDRFGNKTSYGYDGAGRLSWIKDPFRNRTSTGRYMQVSYDANGHLATVQDTGTAARVTSYTVNAGNQLTRITDPDAAHTDFTYATDSVRLKTITDRLGGVRRLSYQSSFGKLLYDSLPSVPIDNGTGSTTSTNPVLTHASWSYTGIPTSPTGITPAPIVIADAAVDDITGAVIVHTPTTTNSWGLPLSIQGPYGKTTLTWSGLYPTSIKTPDGATRQATYDAVGNPLTTTDAGGSVTHYHYGVFAQVDSVWGDLVPLQRRYLDATTGRIDSVAVSRIDTTGAVVIAKQRWKYDSVGRVVSHRDELNHKDSTVYGTAPTYANGNASWSSSEGGVIVTKTFDVYGRDSTVSVTGQPTRTQVYDILNRPTQFSDGINATPTIITYNALYETRVTNPKGEIAEKVTRNALGWVTARYDTYDTTKSQTYTYTIAGQLARWTNRRGQPVVYSYDSHGALGGRSYGTGLPLVDSYTTTATTTTAWNALVRDSAIATPASRKLRSVAIYSGGANIAITHWGRQTMLQRDSVVGTQGTSTVFRWGTTTDSSTGQLRWLGSLQDTTFGVMLSKYTLTGHVVGMSYGVTTGSVGETLGYTDRLLLKLQTLAGLPGASGSAQFDTLNRVRAWQLNGGPPHTTAYAYDGLGRLSADSSADSAAGVTYQPVTGGPYGAFNKIGRYTPATVRTFTYDAAGNWVDLTGVVAPGNRLVYARGDSLFYDLDGNVTTKKVVGGPTVQYTWDALGRLTGVSSSLGTAVTYQYDALDRLVSRATNGTIDRWWVWDGQTLAAELSGTQGVQQTYGDLGPDMPLIATYLDSVGGTQGLYAQMDVRHNVWAWLDRKGNLVQSLRYEAWGTPNATGVTGGIGLSRRWKGATWEGSSAYGGNGRGATYLRARWYDPEVGRFLSEDPTGVEGGMNLYAFGSNDPINARDPSGLKVAFYNAEAEQWWNKLKRNESPRVSRRLPNVRDLDHGSTTEIFARSPRPRHPAGV